MQPLRKRGQTHFSPGQENASYPFFVIAAQVRGQVLHGAAPLEHAVHVGVKPVLLLHVGDLGAHHVDLVQIVLTQAGLVGVVEIAEPTGIDFHARQAHAINRQEIRGGQGDAMPHRGARHGAVALHALVAVHDADSPVGGKHLLGGEEHVVVARADAYVKLALLAIGIIIIPQGRSQGRSHDHVLDRHGGHHHVVRLQHRGGNEESIGVDEPSAQPDGDDMQVVVDAVQESVVALIFVGNLKLQVEGLVIGEDLVPAELTDGLLARKIPGISDEHGTFEAGGEVVEDAAQGIGLGGTEQPPSRLDAIELDENVLLGLESGPDLVVDRDQGIVNVLAPAVPLDQGHFGAAFEVLEILVGIASAHAGVVLLPRCVRHRSRRRRGLLSFQDQPLGGGNRRRAGKERSACS